MARDHIDGPIFITFNDTIIDTDLSCIEKTTADGLIWVKKIKSIHEARRLGVAVTKGSVITELIEKSDTPPSTLAMVGMYYLKDGKVLIKYMERVIHEGRTVRGEFYLPEPLQDMIDEHYNLEATQVDDWYDCGTIETLLETNRNLLDNGEQRIIKYDDSAIIEPVFIEDGVDISRSVIGPHVSIAAGSKIRNSVVQDSIINEKAQVHQALLKNCLIGESAYVEGAFYSLNVGDHSVVTNG